MLTREQLLARKAGQETVTLGNGDKVLVRGMTRGEAAEMRKLDQDDLLGLEAFGIATCMIDPKISIEDARAWLEADGGAEIQKVIDAIQGNSGQADGQAKEYTKSVPRRR